jgi:cysteine desulfurase
MNAAGAKALSLAVSLAVQNLANHQAHTDALRERLVAGVLSSVEGAKFSRADAPGLPSSAHFTFDGCSGDSLLFLLDQAGICVSNGSACTAGVASASHVLMAMGRSEVEASGCIRVSFGDTTTLEDIDAFLAELPKAHAAARLAGLTSS